MHRQQKVKMRHLRLFKLISLSLIPVIVMQCFGAHLVMCPIGKQRKPTKWPASNGAVALSVWTVGISQPWTRFSRAAFITRSSDMLMARCRNSRFVLSAKANICKNPLIMLMLSAPFHTPAVFALWLPWPLPMTWKWIKSTSAKPLFKVISYPVTVAGGECLLPRLRVTPRRKISYGCLRSRCTACRRVHAAGTSPCRNG